MFVVSHTSGVITRFVFFLQHLSLKPFGPPRPCPTQCSSSFREPSTWFLHGDLHRANVRSGRQPKADRFEPHIQARWINSHMRVASERGNADGGWVSEPASGSNQIAPANERSSRRPRASGRKKKKNRKGKSTKAGPRNYRGQVVFES